MNIRDRYGDSDRPHEHSYLPLQTGGVKTVFEAVPVGVYGEADLFRMVEYMYLFCKCGESIRTKIKRTVEEGQ